MSKLFFEKCRKVKKREMRRRTPNKKNHLPRMSGTSEIRAGVHAPRADVADSSVDYPAVKVRYASYENIEKRALIHQQDSGDITKDFLVS
jgi:hypothetical protein